MEINGRQHPLRPLTTEVRPIGGQQYRAFAGDGTRLHWPMSKRVSGGSAVSIGSRIGTEGPNTPELNMQGCR